MGTPMWKMQIYESLFELHGIIGKYKHVAWWNELVDIAYWKWLIESWLTYYMVNSNYIEIYVTYIEIWYVICIGYMEYNDSGL